MIMDPSLTNTNVYNCNVYKGGRARICLDNGHRDWTLDFAARNKRPLFLNQFYYYISRTLSTIMFKFSVQLGPNDSHVFTSRGVCDCSGACARAVTRIHEFHSWVICVQTCRVRNSIIVKFMVLLVPVDKSNLNAIGLSVLEI